MRRGYAHFDRKGFSDSALAVSVSIFHILFAAFYSADFRLPDGFSALAGAPCSVIWKTLLAFSASDIDFSSTGAKKLELLSPSASLARLFLFR